MLAKFFGVEIGSFFGTWSLGFGAFGGDSLIL
jgi:hypothetical protein